MGDAVSGQRCEERERERETFIDTNTAAMYSPPQRLGLSET